MDEDGGNIVWEDGDDDDDEDIDWENNQDHGEGVWTKVAPAGGVEEEEDEDEEHLEYTNERRWLGDNGEIVVELPRETEDGVFNELEANDTAGEGGVANAAAYDDPKSRAKAKTKIRRFTAEETRRALNIHKAHLTCLVARCSLVSRWAGDPAVLAAMVSCLPTELLMMKPTSAACRGDPQGGAGSAPRASEGLRLTALVVWFRSFLAILDEEAVGGGGDGLWGSRPARLLRVVDQRVGCAQEAVQLFVALCRGLGLRARYVACLDPLPPHPSPRQTTKRQKRSGSPATIDLSAEGQGRRPRRRGGGGGLGDRTGLGVRSNAWAEVLCRGGEEDDGLYVVAPTRNSTGVPEKMAPPQSASTPQQRPHKRRRASNSQTERDQRSNSPVISVEADDQAAPASSNSRPSDTGMGEGLTLAAPSKKIREDSDDDTGSSTGVVTLSKRKAVGRASPRLSDQGGSGAGTRALSKGRDRVTAAESETKVKSDVARSLGSNNGSGGGLGGRGIDDGPKRTFPVTMRERWVHVDPVEGAVDQASKVQDLRFRKRLMPYVVAEDEDHRIVDVTRRYTTEWSRTLRTRGRAMASPNGWWNRALRLWGASAGGGGKPLVMGTGGADSPLVVDGYGADTADTRAREEKELQDKVDKEPVPNTIVALKNHHVYVLGKNLLKHEGLRPGAKAAGLVKGCKVFLKSDVARLKGASRWKLDGLKVKTSELEKPAKVNTKKGEKDGEGTSKLYGEWQTEPWVPEPAVDGKVPKNEYGNVEFFECSPALLPAGTEHVCGDQISRVASKLGLDYAPALVGFETRQGRQVPVLDGIIVCQEQCQMLRDAHTAWEQNVLEKRAKAREQRLLRRWRTLFVGVMEGARILEEYGNHNY